MIFSATTKLGVYLTGSLIGSPNPGVGNHLQTARRGESPATNEDKTKQRRRQTCDEPS